MKKQSIIFIILSSIGQALYTLRQDESILHKLQNYFDGLAGQFWKEEEDKEYTPAESSQAV